VPGSTLNENNFLRSYSNDTYLWYGEIVDRDPGLYNDPLDYFELLKTTAVTTSGAPKDKFHFTYDSQEWYELSQGGVSAGYGAQFVLLSAVPPREVVIAYTEPNSPATTLNPPLARGARVLAIDGVDINDNTQAGIDTLNAGLFPSDTTTPHTFEILDLGAASSRTVTMTAEEITSDPVRGETIIPTAMGDVGYMVFNDHIATAEQALIDAVDYFNTNGPIDELILDIRYNGGGYLAIASQLAYMIGGDVPTAGRTFEQQQFNDKYPDTNPLTGQALLPTPFYDTTLGLPFNGGAAGQPLPSLNLSRVFVLTGSGTCSASEAIMNGLLGVDVEVIQIGSTTCGKPYGFYATDNCGTTYFTIQFRGVNAKDFGDYTDGFSPSNTPANQAGTVIPGCSVGDDFDKALGDTTEARLAAALGYLNNGTCPAPSGLAPGDVLGKPGAPAIPADGFLPKSPWHTNRMYVP
jgi:C-terminal processing protease CtpA/Prc